MSFVPNFDLVEPANVEEAVAARAAAPEARYIAGGTDFIPNLRHGLEKPSQLVWISQIPELKAVEDTAEALVIGACVTLATLEEDDDLLAGYPALKTAIGMVAAPGHRQMATVGGNLCLDTRCIFYNRSAWWRKANNYCLKKGGDTCHVAPTGDRCHAAFSGDLAPALMALGAEAEIAGPEGRRRQPVAALYQDDGRAHLTLGPEELLVAVHIPKASAALRNGYLKSRVRRSFDFPLAGVAVALRRDGDNIEDLRIALTGTNSFPVQLEGLDDLNGKPLGEDTLKAVNKVLARSIKPMRTTLVPGLYRRHVAGALTKRLITRLYEGTDATGE